MCTDRFLISNLDQMQDMMLGAVVLDDLAMRLNVNR